MGNSDCSKFLLRYDQTVRCTAFLLMALSCMAEYATVDGHRVFYQTHGRGALSVVLVHGWTCDGTFWDAQKDVLAAKHRVLVLDLPGHGRSDKPVIDYDLPVFS